MEHPTEDLGTDQLEFDPQSFIIKIWLEETDKPSWRGHITHVPSGRRRYLLKLSEIIAFIQPYLRSRGIRLGFLRRLRKK